MTKTVKLEYIGPKSVYEDVDFKTGEWTPGDKKDVPVEVAPYMLFHHDMFKDARSAVAQKKEPISPQQKPTNYKKIDKIDLEPPLANLSAMTKQGLAQYAQSNFQHNFDYDKTTAGQMRTEIIGLMRQRA